MALFLLCAVTAGLAVLALMALALGHDLIPARRRTSPRAKTAWSSSWAPALAVAVAVTVLTRWPVAGAVIGGAVFLWPRMTRGGVIERASVHKLEALATWTESLRDAAATAAALETAIPLTQRGAPPPLAPAITNLVNSLAVRVPLPQALTAFADELDDPTADLVVAALSLNARQRGGSLRRVLTTLAAHTRDELTSRREVLHERNAIRRQSQQVAAAILVLAVGQAVLAPAWVAPYGTALGQIVLALLGGGYLALAVRLQKLSAPEPEPRFLAAAGEVTEMASWRGGLVPG